MGPISESCVMFSVGPGAKQTILAGTLIAEKAASSFFDSQQHKWYLRLAKLEQQGKVTKPLGASKSHAAGAPKRASGNKATFLASPMVRCLPLFSFPVSDFERLFLRSHSH